MPSEEGVIDTNTTASELVDDYADLIKGKVVLTTGVSLGGLGASFVQDIASANPSLLILGSRDLIKTGKVASAITTAHPNVKTRLLKIDLASFQSVRDAQPSAGIMAVEYGLSVDGFELHLASNHLGQFLFTNLIIDKVLASKTPCIVNVTSSGPRFSPFRFGDYDFDVWDLLLTLEAKLQPMARLWPVKIRQHAHGNLTRRKTGKTWALAFSVHPGGIMSTNLANHLDFSKVVAAVSEADLAVGNAEGFAPLIDPTLVKSIERGTATYIYVAFDPNLKVHNGAYTLDSHIADPFIDPVKAWTTSSFEAEKLWRLSEQLVGQKFSY
ncbi:retinol dehydrogenase 13 [Gymnopilus junonius]|uniref:Retinol dehydrogenase 13 n=1 Tax=Gymnopilus junonius TaxID=109634 RepID=A0A9P5TLL9_GYMJU|nr:retinol dehydrogenase 13 [Gymnopilus junonius]